MVCRPMHSFSLCSAVFSWISPAADKSHTATACSQSPVIQFRLSLTVPTARPVHRYLMPKLQLPEERILLSEPLPILFSMLSPPLACPPFYRLSGFPLLQARSYKFRIPLYDFLNLFLCLIDISGIVNIACAFASFNRFYYHLHHLSKMYVLLIVRVYFFFLLS